MNLFYDAHAHCIESQKGGFLIALEGEPIYEKTYNNIDIYNLNFNSNFIPVEYITKNFNQTSSQVIKYHARREKYTRDAIINDIDTRKAKIVIIDTLNTPYYDYRDYWEIVSSFKNIFFILAHCGGYDIDDFIKIIDFNRNVYTDFSLTLQYFGIVKNNPYIKIMNAMDYMLQNSKINKRILFGSDNPFYSQKEAYNYYYENGYMDLLNNNYLRLCDEADL